MVNLRDIRKEMIKIGLAKGLAHSETIKLSQQLDSVLIGIQQQKLRSLKYRKE